ncbi:MAG: acetoacetyl-CoA synthetase, partial [Halothiobacillaceae bacterium]
MTTPLWSPAQERIEQTNLFRFMAYLHEAGVVAVDDYAALYAWSINHPEPFWAAIWTFCQVKSSQPWSAVLQQPASMPGAEWFIGARLNFAENLLSRRDETPALIFWAEDQPQRTISYAELYQQVEQLASAMRQRGVTVGDRVAGFMPNIPETVVAMLATASLGAIWSSCSPDFGVTGAVERFAQIEPKLLFCADGYLFKGQRHDSLARVVEIARLIPSLATVIVVPYTEQNPDVSAINQAELLPHVMQSAPREPLCFAQLPFNHPLYILYSSGTTGLPKCIVHGAGGTLIQHLKELVLHTDLKENDRIFYFTTCGWMMWNWLVSSLATGATVMLYDGSPFHPHPEILFDFIEQESITIFGTSAKYLAAVEKSGAIPRQSHNLAS